MGERLTKKERKAIIAASLRDPHATIGQKILLSKMYSGLSKKKVRPPKDKEPVTKDLTADEKLWEEVYRIERERDEEARQGHKSSERRLQELKELQRRADIAQGDPTNCESQESPIPPHLRADIN